MNDKKPDNTPMRNIPPFGLRMQPDLKARIEEAAAANGRSLNAEIVQRLEASFEKEEGPEVLQVPSKDILYVMIDANGLPVGWDELMVHLGQLVRNAGGEFRRVDAIMMNSTIPKGQDPSERVSFILQRYRDKKFNLDLD